MSIKHPIISVTGSSGAGTTSVRQTFENIFRREHVRPAFVQGDAFHRYDRCGMEKAMREAAKRGNPNFSHFGLEANLIEELETLFRTYSESGKGLVRNYVHDDAEERALGTPIGSFTPWTEIEPDTDVLMYEGLHGAIVTGDFDVARHADLKIGVVPVINLEWIQKIQRDRTERGYTTEDVTQSILRRMPDYVQYICPQFTQTDINFQRIPTVDTSNPFIARWIPTPDESMVIIRFKEPRGIDFAYLLSMIHDSFMSRANSIVIPGSKLDLAMQLILTPLILQLVERRRRVI
ncbi:phosphoribulokinase [Hyphomicrobium sp.]|uniref:phosphoribulokinase n=1 Tax=Hyphomicrobium sp. TaxID=82 RepID=UPI000FA8FDA6|nr:phosphoribulokinase [Hyphomicrobium sp.]MBN9245953.1 phosphoribulokinase [Hyphomicrobium sp.]RUP07435.1 MAG: phosphoribulokinase [Hyphomicrobium sp.]